jgi:hypothetical protein
VPEKNKEMRPALYFISEGLILKKKESFICDCSFEDRTREIYKENKDKRMGRSH